VTTDAARPIIRWGVVGTGTIARAFAEDLRLLPDASLCAVASRNRDRAQAFLKEFGGGQGRTHDSVEELARNPEVDVVYVATPHTRHKDDCMACLEGGRAVLCEKPFTVDANEARAVVAQARKSQKFCMEAMWMRFHPLVLKVRDLVQSGKLGEIRLLTADFGYPTSFDPESRFFNPTLGGGALLDRGVYPLSLAYFLLGRPNEVVGQATIGTTGVDEQETTLLSYSSGALAVLAASLRSRLRNEAVIIGTEGRIRIHEPFYAPSRITWTRTREPVGPVPAASSGSGGWKSRIKRNPLLRRAVDHVARPLLGAIRRDSTTITEHIAGQGYQFEAAEAMRCIRAGVLESPIMSLDDSVAILESTDALRRSWIS
jgi:predicted dehydrogenase